ncbi:fibrillarin-like rRNA/tRNA 2'-O-methyltransferase [Candidatus Woesearchaeota archaeon]|nr:fibrillarin-like rRNA/tRNA 2'-O-methyltransferase [Candidatus Woesearchaeota archaeon]MCF8014051.1 fibrillarin-like rRNA/tRNA 2'-O-methyltransferase [Candidatus Woesearchaeota archaeon]
MEEINKFKVFRIGKGKNTSYYTRSLYPKYRGFDENIFRQKGEEFREVDAERSKFIAAIAKGLSQTGVKEGSVVLYLGASHGYTPSFMSDIIGDTGFMFALDFAPRVVRDLVFVCERRANMAPMLDDASHPENYKDLVPQVDVVFQDIAQRNQVEIFSKNCDMFLKQGGFGLLALKSRSIDVTRKPKEVFMEVRKELEKKFNIVDYRELYPFEKDHAFFVIKKK